MQRLRLLQQLAVTGDSKILFWVFDGLGGLPRPETGLSELETAHLPHLDAFAQRSSCGAHEPCGPGVTTGSGFGHMALFGYPVEGVELPRGALEVLGSHHAFQDGLRVPAHLGHGELAIRGNFAAYTIEVASGERVVADRRANSISTMESSALCELLSLKVSLPGVICQWVPGRDHRFALTLAGPEIHPGVTDSDPQRSGLAPWTVAPTSEASHRTAALINMLISQVEDVLATQDVADTILLRGAGCKPCVPTLEELYGLRAAAIATYPVYNGVARLLGMTVLDVQGAEPEDQLRALEASFEDHDFFFFHIKATDSLAHAGDFDGKVAYFERCDALFARALELGFDVVVVTGDHCTPSIMGEHSWHPVPAAMWSKTIFAGETRVFTERGCSRGSLGLRQARDLMPLALAEARRLKAYGP